MARDLTRLPFELVKPVPHVLITVAEQPVFLLGCERLIDERGQRFVHFLPPDRPELGRRAAGCILRLILRHGEQHLAEDEKSGDSPLVLLIANHLADGLLRRLFVSGKCG